MQSGHKRIFFEEEVFLVDENVYEPAEDSFLFAENLRVNEGARVLDMGTGCGILGIVAAGMASEVVAVDVNSCAVRCAEKNAIINGAHDKIAFVIGDLFAPLSNKFKFDVIIFNAPYLPVENDEDTSLLSLAWKGGRNGRVLIDRFINQVQTHLKKCGKVLLLQSTLSGVKETINEFRQHGFESNIIAECSVPFFETIMLIEAKKP